MSGPRYDASCPFVAHAACCRCHRGDAILMDIPPAALPPLEEVLRSVEAEQGVPADQIEPERDRVLERARYAISGPRQRDYGSPEPSFTRTGRMWAAILGVPEVTAEQVAACMIAVKLARLSESPNHRDSWDDIAGYAALGGEVAYDRGVSNLNAAMHGSTS